MCTGRITGAEWTWFPRGNCIQFFADNLLPSASIETDENSAGQYLSILDANSASKIERTAMEQISPIELIFSAVGGRQTDQIAHPRGSCVHIPLTYNLQLIEDQFLTQNNRLYATAQQIQIK